MGKKHKKDNSTLEILLAKRYGQVIRTTPMGMVDPMTYSAYDAERLWL